MVLLSSGEVGAWVREQFRGVAEAESSRLERAVLAKSLQLEDHEVHGRLRGGSRAHGEPRQHLPAMRPRSKAT